MKKYLVIGNPIEHSLSPQLHNYWFQKAGIDAVYNKKNINENDIKGIIDEVKNDKINGVNVTVPFKKSIIPFLDKLTPEADKVQSVNTIFKKNNKIIGANTDIWGFEHSLINHEDDFKWDTGQPLKNKKVFILGAGGVASSIIFVLKKMGVSKITLSNRTKKRAENLKKMYPSLEIIDWGKSTEFDMIINATSLGLKDEDKIELDFRSDNQKKIFYDLIYKTRGKQTDFISKAQKLGHITLNGSLMFIYQAAAAFDLWNKHNLDWSPNIYIDAIEELDLTLPGK